MSNIVEAIKEIYPEIKGGFVYWETQKDGTPWPSAKDGLIWENTEFTKPTWTNIQSKITTVNLKKAKEAKIKICKDYLVSTDWYILREADQPDSYPAAIKTHRINARTAINEIESLTTITAVNNYDISAFTT